MAFAPPTNGTVNVNRKIGDAGCEHHGSFRAIATKEDNCPNHKIDDIVRHPNPPSFSVAHNHKNETTEINAIRSGVKKTEALTRD